MAEGRNNGLKGKRIALTGGTGGLGQPLVNLLLGAGAEVALLGRSAAHLPHDVRRIPVDLSDEGSLKCAAVELATLDVDVLVHLAGLQHFGDFAGQAADGLRQMFNVNLVAPALLTHAVLPGMKRRGSGHVVFAGSVFGAIPFAHFAGYSSTKAGLAALALSLQREYRGSGIAFTCAVPRAIRTNMASDLIRRFSDAAGFRFDAPEAVAFRLFRIIEAGGGDLRPGMPESLFMRLHALAPGLVGKALHGTDIKARSLLSNQIHDQGVQS